MQTQRLRIAGSRLATAAGVLGLAVDAGYLVIIFAQGERSYGRVAVVFVFILAVSVLALLGGSAFNGSARTRVILLGASTGGLLTAGVLGIFSIGLPLLVAGLMSAVALARFANSARPLPTGVLLLSTGAAIGCGSLLVLGIAIS